jgi:riboflavin kinase/FMN adenylyltransferase
MKQGAVVTLGVFDGVHIGHRAVLGRVAELAHRRSATTVAFTFDRAPGAVLSDSPEHPRLTLLGEKVGLLRTAGAGEVRVLRFTAGLASKSAERFLADHLLADYDLKGLVVGYDFALGHGREGTVSVLRALGGRHGFPVEAVAAVERGGQAVSSTRIRGVLRNGEAREAARLLGRPYRLGGRVVRGEARGRQLGFPTANLDVPPGKLRPGSGVYAVRVHGAGEEPRPGVVNIGRRPTFPEAGNTVEVHLLDWEGNLLGRDLCLDLVERLRAEQKFNSSKDLQDQIRADVETARRLLSRASAELKG